MVSLTPFATLPASFLRCYVRSVSAVGQSFMSVTFALHSAQVRLLLRLRLLCPFLTAFLLLVSRTPLASSSASFLRCQVRCTCAVRQSDDVGNVCCACYAGTSVTPATYSMSLLLVGFTSVLSYSRRNLACFFSALLCKVRLCCRYVCYVGYVCCAFYGSTSVTAVTSPLPFFSAFLLLFSLTPLASWAASSLCCYVTWCSMC